MSGSGEVTVGGCRRLTLLPLVAAGAELLFCSCAVDVSVVGVFVLLLVDWFSCFD